MNVFYTCVGGREDSGGAVYVCVQVFMSRVVVAMVTAHVPSVWRHAERAGLQGPHVWSCITHQGEPGGESQM